MRWHAINSLFSGLLLGRAWTVESLPRRNWLEGEERRESESYVVLASFMKTTYDISLYYQILPHSQMLTIRKKSVAVRKVKSVDYQLPAQP